MAINFDHQRDRISSSSGSLTINTTGALTIPVGTTAQRPTSSIGQIRFNSQQQAFEGYNGAGWSTLGGVRDVDGNTYIVAETSAGANNNELDFWTDGTQRLQIGATGNLLFGDSLDKFTIDFTTGDTAIAGNLDVTGNVTIGGNITIGDADTDAITVSADFNSNLIPDADNTYNLGNALKNWSEAHVRTLTSNTDVITVDVTGALTLPVGTTLERPTAVTGMIRFNTDDGRFEAYDGTAWTGVGGVIDVDQNTYIIAETSPGANNNDLDFYTDGVQRLQIDETGDFLFGDGLNKFTIDWATGNITVAGQSEFASINVTDLTSGRVVLAGLVGELEDSANLTFDGSTLTVDGDVDITGNVTIGGNITIGDADTDAITVAADFESHLIPDADSTYDLGSITKDWRTLYVETITNNDDRLTLTADVVDVDSTGAVILPVGTTLERPTAEQGMIRFNATDGRFEAYDGTAWTGLGGVIDVDQNTYIIAETSPGANNNDLDFWTDGVHRLQIDGSGDFWFGDALNKFTIDWATGNTSIAGTLTIAGGLTTNLTDNRVVIVGASGILEDDANFTFDGTTLNVGSGNFTVTQGTGNTYILGTLETDGQATLASANVEDLTDNRVVIAGASGELEDSADFTFDGTTFDVGQGNFTIDIATGDTFTNGNLEVNGDLVVNGTTTTVNSTTVTIDDPIFTLAGDSLPVVNDAKDRGIEFQWHNGTNAKLGFFGYDESAGVFTFIQDATNTSEVFGGAAGDVAFGSGTFDGTLSTGGQATFASANISDLSNDRIVIVGTSGELEDTADFTFDGTTFNIAVGNFTVDVASGNTYVLGTLEVDGQGTIASLNVEDLTDNRIVLAGTNGELEDSIHLTFDGSTFDIGSGNFTVDRANGNTYLAGTLETDGEATLASAIVEDLTDNRIVLAGTGGALEDSVDLTFDGTELSIGSGNFTVQQATGNVYALGTLETDGEATLASAIVEDLTSGRVVLAGTGGAIEDSANLTFDGSTLAVTGSLTVSVEATLGSAIISDLIDNRIVIAGASGAVEDDANFTFDGTTFDIGQGNATVDVATGNTYILGTLETDGQATLASANVEDLTDNRIVIAGTSGELEDDANFTFDGTTFDIGQGNFTVDVATGNTYTDGDLEVNGDLVVNGTTTTVNSTTVTIDDPIFTLGGDTLPTVDDDKDRGIEFNWHDGTNAKVGFFGFDDSTGKFTFIPDATNTAEVFSGTAGDVEFGEISTTGITADDIQIGVTASNEIDTTTGNLVLDSAGGTVEVDDDLTVSGEATLASAIVSDLTSDRLVLAGAAGALEDTADLTFNGTTLDVGQGNFTVNVSNGDVYVNAGFEVDGEALLASATVEDLTSGRVVLAGTGGSLEDNADLTYDGTTLTVAGNIDVNTQATLASANVEDLTSGRVVLAGTNGELEDSANLTFDGTTLTVTGAATVDNITVDGNTIASANTDGDINITPNGAGEVVISTATVSDLTDTRLVLAGTSGSLEDSADLTFDGTTFDIGQGNFTVDAATGNTAIAGTLDVTGTMSNSTLTNDRVVIVGTGGVLEDSVDFTFNGTALNVGQGIFTVEVATGDTNVNGDLVVGETVEVGSTVGSTSTNTGALTVAGGVGIAENVYIGGSVSIDGTLGTDGGVTLGDDVNTDILTLNAKVTNGIIPSANDTYALGATGEAWKDLFVSESVTFEGGTSDNEIVVPTNLSDGLSITETSGDLIVFKTTSGDRRITLYPNTTIEGNFTLGTSVGTTTVSEILDEDNMASDSDTALATQQSIKAYVDTVEANVAMEFQGDTGAQGSVNLRTEVFNVLGTTNEIETASSGDTLTIGLPDDVTIGNDLTVTNDLIVSGEVATDDNIITIAGTVAATSNNLLDKGVEFQWYTGTTAKLGFFGYDESAGKFTFIADATNTSDVISGSAGDVAFGEGAFTGVTVDNIQVGVTDTNTIDTTSGNLTINSFGGTVTIDDNVSVTGEATLASATVSDLTDNRIVIAGSNGSLEDNDKFRFDGTTFSVGSTGSETFTVAVNTGNTAVSGSLTVQQAADFNSNVTLGSTGSNNIVANGTFASNLVPDSTDTRDLGTTSSAWRDLYLTESITYKGASSENEIVIPTNLADGLSIKDTAGDIIVITTTTGSQLVTIVPDVQIDGSLTLDSGVSVSVILDEDDLSSDSDTALATQQSIKAYVDDQNNAQDLDFAGDLGIGSVLIDSQTFTVAGTTNQIKTQASNQTITVALTDSVTIVDDLNVGNNVVITGDLTVNGTTTTVNTTELVVTDNIITLNEGEAGAGVTAGSSGIEVDRGTESTVSFVWDESTDRWTTGSQNIQAGEFFGTIDGGTF